MHPVQPTWDGTFSNSGIRCNVQCTCKCGIGENMAYMTIHEHFGSMSTNVTVGNFCVAQLWVLHIPSTDTTPSTEYEFS